MGSHTPLTWTCRPAVTSSMLRERLPSRTAVVPGRATTVRPLMTNRLSPVGLRATIWLTFPSISTSPCPIPLRFSSSRTTPAFETCTVRMISWFAFTSANESRPISAAPFLKTRVKPPGGRPRKVKDPSPATVVEIEGSSEHGDGHGRGAGRADAGGTESARSLHGAADHDPVGIGSGRISAAGDERPGGQDEDGGEHGAESSRTHGTSLVDPSKVSGGVERD